MSSTTMSNYNISLNIPVKYVVCLGDEEWQVKDEHGYVSINYGNLQQISDMFPEDIVIPLDPFTAYQEGMIEWSQMKVSEAMKAWFHLLTEESKNDG